MKRAMEYASFGWLIGKNSEHYSRKEGGKVVTLRRDFIIGANPTISDCEKDYLKLEKGKIPSKYLDHVFLKFLARLFLIILLIAFGVVGIAATLVGVYDGFKVNGRVKAIYNAAVECDLVEGDAVLLPDDDPEGGITEGYLKFVSENPTLNTFGELVAFTDDAVGEDKLAESYKKSLYYFGLIEDMKDETVYAVDPTAEKGEEGYPADDAMLNVVFDPVRTVFSKVNFDGMLTSFPDWINSTLLIGGATLAVFLITLLIRGVTAKHRKIKRRKKCAVIMQDCVRQASDALYAIKNEHRETRTKKDEELFDIENVLSKAFVPEGDDFD